MYTYEIVCCANGASNTFIIKGCTDSSRSAQFCEHWTSLVSIGSRSVFTQYFLAFLHHLNHEGWGCIALWLAYIGWFALQAS